MRRGPIFDLIEPFAGYAFNKAHSACYGTIAYQTAYLKANYPHEYMTAVLSSAGTHERIAEAVAECVRLGIARAAARREPQRHQLRAAGRRTAHRRSSSGSPP